MLQEAKLQTLMTCFLSSLCRAVLTVLYGSISIFQHTLVIYKGLLEKCSLFIATEDNLCSCYIVSSYPLSVMYVGITGTNQCAILV